jgi:hypothetical protein
MSGLPDPARTLEGCPLVIFIAYTIGAEAEANGYADWLRRVDMPFFNAIPGTRHYANWRLVELLSDPPPAWDWFDFQGLAEEGDLERVWFNPDLDDFRANWLRLWGYGSDAPPPVLRHSYLMRPVGPRRPADGAVTATLSGGTGALPAQGSADLLFRVDGTLHKHFGGRDDSRPWLTPAARFNPLGLDWIGIGWGAPPPVPGASLAASAALVAAPDRI